MKINQRQFIVTLTVTENDHRSISLQTVEGNRVHYTYIPAERDDTSHMVTYLEGVLEGMPKPEKPE